LLLDTDFQSGRLIPPAPLTRDKGWRASPIWDKAAANAISARAFAAERHVALGYGLGDGTNSPAIAHGTRIVLAQEIRSARGGHYSFTVRASGGGTSAEYFEKTFLAHFTCRLQLFRFGDMNKDPRNVSVLATADFRPAFGDAKTAGTFKVDRFLGSTIPNQNFPIGNGLGVAVVVEKTSPGALPLAMTGPHQAFVRIHAVSLEFSARPRDESVVD
jgi:hypothetical protein